MKRKQRHGVNEYKKSVKKKQERLLGEKLARRERLEDKRIRARERKAAAKEWRSEVNERKRERARARREREAVETKEKRARDKVKAKRQARKKPEGAPTRPRSARVFFVSENWASTHKAGTPATATMVELTKRFNALTPDERKGYEDRASKDRERYENEQKEWIAKNPSQKKPIRSPYMIFVIERRPDVVKSNPNLKITDIARELGKQWRALSPSEQSAFKAKLPVVA